MEGVHMTIKEQYIQNILDFLNFPEDASFEDIRNYLLEKEFCRFELVVKNDEETFHSLFFRHEVQERQAAGLPVSVPLSQAIRPVDDKQTYSLITDPAYYREHVIFPDPAPAGDGGAACKAAFYTVVRWFQTFMLGCSAGVIDVATLNRFKSTRRLILEFRQTRDAMNPILLPIGMEENTVDGLLEQKILTSLIYPFIFNSAGDALARIKRCRQCGRFFHGVRLHASFCSTKCRMAWNYASRA